MVGRVEQVVRRVPIPGILAAFDFTDTVSGLAQMNGSMAGNGVGPLLRRAGRCACLEKWPASRELYEHVLAIEPGNARALIGAGRAALQSGDFGACVERLTEAARTRPGNALILRQLGYAHRRLGNLKATVEAYSRSLKLEPGDAVIHNNRRGVFRRR